MLQWNRVLQVIKDAKHKGTNMPTIMQELKLRQAGDKDKLRQTLDYLQATGKVRKLHSPLGGQYYDANQNTSKITKRQRHQLLDAREAANNDREKSNLPKIESPIVPGEDPDELWYN